jgi:hypothetical protein
MDDREEFAAELHDLDRFALQAGVHSLRGTYDALMDACDGPDPFAANRERLAVAVRYLLELRFDDPQAFDVACLKLLDPGLTHDEVAEIMTTLGRANWRSMTRRRNAQCRLRDLERRHPALAGVLIVDRRGGPRDGCTNPRHRVGPLSQCGTPPPSRYC